MSEDINSIYEKKIKDLIKSNKLETWEEAMKEEQFVKFLINYKDEDYNNIYHLIFKNKKTMNDLYNTNEIVSLLISKEIPMLSVNIKNELPNKLIDGKAVFILNLVNKQLEIESENKKNIDIDYEML